MGFDKPLLNLAAVLLAGILGGELLGRLRLPKVTGWIGTGIALRALAVPGLEPASLGRFSPFTDFVLGFIAFTVGATLHVASLRNAGSRLAFLVLCEATLLPLIVFPLLYYVGHLPLPAALVLTAIAIAGAPGTTVLVVREARARGTLSRTLVAAVGLIDMVAVGGSCSR
jgi:Kef-type K+ transport system membrane component KefB